MGGPPPEPRADSSDASRLREPYAATGGKRLTRNDDRTDRALCGSGLHLIDGHWPTTQSDGVLEFELMGAMVEKGLARSYAEPEQPDRRAVQHRLRQGPPVQDGQPGGARAEQPKPKMTAAMLGHICAGGPAGRRAGGQAGRDPAAAKVWSTLANKNGHPNRQSAPNATEHHPGGAVPTTPRYRVNNASSAPVAALVPRWTIAPRSRITA